MLSALKAMFRPPQPAGPPQIIRRFGLLDAPIAQDVVTIEDGAWRIDVRRPQSVKLYELAEPGVEHCLLTYRLSMRTAELSDKVHLEMWCRFPGRGEFFSKGLHNAATGTTDWASYETPFHLKAGQCPDLIRLELKFAGSGTAWVKDVELLRTPLA